MHEILTIEGPGLMGSGTVEDPHYEMYYFEGHSPKLLDLEPDRRAIKPQSDWFCFEEPLALGCAILNLELGFTVEQIMEARKREEG